MVKIGETYVQRSDGNWEVVDLHEPGDFNHDPLLVQLSDGRWGTPNLQPLGDGNTGILVQASDGTWYQVNSEGTPGGGVTDVIEDWESGDFSNWGYRNGLSISAQQTFQGTYSVLGNTDQDNQSVSDNERDHGQLPRYQQLGETVRLFGYYGAAEDNTRGIARIRWSFGGIYADDTYPSYYVQWNVNDSGLHIINSSNHGVIDSAYDFTYPGNEWWAIEIEWGDPTLTARLVDYSDPDNPVVQDTAFGDDTNNQGNTYLGHQWWVWNNTSVPLYSDYAAVI